MKTILLTGGSGFLGQHLIHTFLSAPDKIIQSRNYRIIAVSRAVQDLSEATRLVCGDAIASHIDFIALDIANEKEVSAFISSTPNKIDVCIHTAAISSPRICQENPEEAQKTNTPTAFFDALWKGNPEMTMIALSTDQVYAGTNAPYTETNSVQPCNIYGLSKVSMEDWLQSNYPQQSVILRSSIIIGQKAPIAPEKAHSTFLHFVESRKGIDTVFYTDECRNVVAASDVVATILFFTEHEACPTTPYRGIFNMGGPESLSRMQMARGVFEHLQFDVKNLKAQQKVDEPVGPVRSPLDISMDSTKLYNTTGLTFKDFKGILSETFDL